MSNPNLSDIADTIKAVTEKASENPPIIKGDSPTQHMPKLDTSGKVVFLG